MVTFFSLLQMLADLFRVWLKEGDPMLEFYEVVGGGGMLFFCSSIVAASLVDVWLGDAIKRVKATYFVTLYAFIPIVIFGAIIEWYSHLVHQLEGSSSGGPLDIAEEERMSAFFVFVLVCMAFTVMAKYQSTPPRNDGQ